jgi:hypothetical protein
VGTIPSILHSTHTAAAAAFHSSHLTYYAVRASYRLVLVHTAAAAALSSSHRWVPYTAAAADSSSSHFPNYAVSASYRWGPYHTYIPVAAFRSSKLINHVVRSPGYHNYSSFSSLTNHAVDFSTGRYHTCSIFPQLPPTYDVKASYRQVRYHYTCCLCLLSTALIF